MAITKIISSIHASSKGYKYCILKKTIDYIENPEKTNNGLYVGYQNCIPGHAMENFIDTYKFYKKEPRNCHDRIANHWTISWKEGTKIEPEMAMQITKEFVNELLGQYEAVYSVHTDKEHIHSHIVFNHVSFRNGYKFRYENNDWEKKIQPITDKLCKKYGLPTLEMELAELDERETEEEWKERKEKQRRRTYKKQMDYVRTQKKSRSNNNYYNERTEPYSKQDHLRVDIDHAILMSSDWSEFLRELNKMGYRTKDKKYLSILGKGMERYRRTYQLGVSYTKENIIRRIEAKFSIPEIKTDADPEMYFEKKLDKIGRIVLTQQSRKHYMEQYRAGLLKPGQNRSYYVIRKALREKQKRERVEIFLQEKGIQNIQSARRALKEYPALIHEVKEKKKIFADSVLPYKELLAEYKNCRDLRTEYECYLEDGNPVFADSYQSYSTFLDHLQHYEMTLDDLEEFSNQVKEKRKSLQKELKELQKEQLVIVQYLNELGEDVQLNNLNSSIEFKTDRVEKSEKTVENHVKENQESQSQKLLDITINIHLITEENDKAVKTRVPGTWGQNIRYLWISRKDIENIHDGKTILTYLDSSKEYSLYDENNQVVEIQKGEELYKHYDQVDSYVREQYEEKNYDMLQSSRERKI